MGGKERLPFVKTEITSCCLYIDGTVPERKEVSHIRKRGLASSNLHFFRTIAGMEKSGQDECKGILSVAFIISSKQTVLSERAFVYLCFVDTEG